MKKFAKIALGALMVAGAAAATTAATTTPAEARVSVGIGFGVPGYYGGYYGPRYAAITTRAITMPAITGLYDPYAVLWRRLLWPELLIGGFGWRLSRRLWRGWHGGGGGFGGGGGGFGGGGGMAAAMGGHR